MTHDLIQELLLFALLVHVGVLLFRSRRWTIPVQTAEIDLLRQDQAALRANLLRVERDLAAWRKEDLDTNYRILREVEAIHANGDAEKALRVEVAAIDGRVLELEQGVPAQKAAIAFLTAEQQSLAGRIAGLAEGA